MAVGRRGVVRSGATVEEQLVAVGVAQQGQFGEQEVGIAATGQGVGATIAGNGHAATRQEVVTDAAQDGVGTQAAQHDVAVGADAVTSEAGAVVLDVAQEDLGHVVFVHHAVVQAGVGVHSHVARCRLDVECVFLAVVGNDAVAVQVQARDLVGRLGHVDADVLVTVQDHGLDASHRALFENEVATGSVCRAGARTAFCTAELDVVGQGAIGEAATELVEVGVHIFGDVGVGGQVEVAVELGERLAGGAAFVQAVLHEVVNQIGRVEAGTTQIVVLVGVVDGVKRAVGLVHAVCADLHEVLEGRQRALVGAHVRSGIEGGIEGHVGANLAAGQSGQGFAQLDTGGEVHIESLSNVEKIDRKTGALPDSRPEDSIDGTWQHRCLKRLSCGTTTSNTQAGVCWFFFFYKSMTWR